MVRALPPRFFSSDRFRKERISGIVYPVALRSHTVRPIVLASVLALGGCAIFGDPNEVTVDDMNGPADTGSDDAGTSPSDMAADAGTAGEDSGTTSDSGGEDAASFADMDRPDCQAQVLAANLQVEWTTPNTMYVTWDRFNPEASVREYEMLVGRTSVDVEDEVNVRKYSAHDNGEFRRTDGEFPVDWSVAWGLEPERDYFVKLIAYDENWCHSESNIVSGTTLPDVSNEHVIFSENPTSGFSVPPGVTYSNRHPYSGQFHYEWKVDCENADSCFDIVRRGAIDQPLQGFAVEDFDSAFLEFAWHNEGSLFAQWPAVRFALRDPETGEKVWWKAQKRAPTGPSANYRLFQVPLRFFRSDGGLPEPRDIRPEDVAGSVDEFGVGAAAEEGTFLSWDEVRLRW